MPSRAAYICLDASPVLHSYTEKPFGPESSVGEFTHTVVSSPKSNVGELDRLRFTESLLSHPNRSSTLTLYKPGLVTLMLLETAPVLQL